MAVSFNKPIHCPVHPVFSLLTWLLSWHIPPRGARSSARAGSRHHICRGSSDRPRPSPKLNSKCRCFSPRSAPTVNGNEIPSPGIHKHWLSLGLSLVIIYPGSSPLFVRLLGGEQFFFCYRPCITKAFWDLNDDGFISVKRLQ